MSICNDNQTKHASSRVLETFRYHDFKAIIENWTNQLRLSIFYFFLKNIDNKFQFSKDGQKRSWSRISSIFKYVTKLTTKMTMKIDKNETTLNVVIPYFSWCSTTSPLGGKFIVRNHNGFKLVEMGFFYTFLSHRQKTEGLSVSPFPASVFYGQNKYFSYQIFTHNVAFLPFCDPNVDLELLTLDDDSVKFINGFFGDVTTLLSSNNFAFISSIRGLLFDVGRCCGCWRVGDPVWEWKEKNRIKSLIDFHSNKQMVNLNRIAPISLFKTH